MITVNNTVPHNNFVIKYAKITVGEFQIDVTNEIKNLIIIESLDSLATGQLVLQNRANITGDIRKFTGQEMLSVSFASGKGTSNGNSSLPLRKTYTKHFRIINVGFVNDSLVMNPTTELTLDFTSGFEVINQTNRISKFYGAVTPTDVISDICNEYFDDVIMGEFEATMPIGNYTCGVERPLQIINNLLPLCQSVEYDESDAFKFFENANGIQCISYGNMKSKDAKATFLIKEETVCDGGATNVINIDHVDAFNMSNIDIPYCSGALGANVMATSIIDKSFNFVKLNRTEFDKNNKNLNTYSPVRRFESISTESMHTYNYNVHVSSDGIYQNLQYKKTDGSLNNTTHHYAKMIIENAKMNSKGIALATAGYTDLAVGDVVYVNLLDYNPMDRSKVAKNTNLSGRWIIQAMKYMLNTSQFDMEFTLISDSNT